ncbi:3-isopropylmalate dehydratase large subunit [Haloquadratum walsbyi]|uniref:3-isopropylmalate dehydratase large subunit n=1 Tax=Haloquadratum walsbyi (strain DSM 16854 / JCM 12705 / C23) TaxID=768065 RepID=G0LLN9_HALWC|nr:3-isopropylmalate dehydratase large subunit [Haloquadratum walsbyi]CCC40845.1 3-isopropylmalate dehydratase large subunit [Haloquadratum walsbyi C23]
MSSNTLYDTVWEKHKVAELPNGQDQLFIGLHLVHEVTSPQAFGMLRERDLDVAFPDRTFATTDHIAPTTPQGRERPLQDDQAENMLQALEHNTSENGITFFGLNGEKQGITHVVAPELGLSQPGMTVACGDSHTSTHGAFGSVGIGIGTSQIRDVLATGCIAAEKQQVRRIEVTGTLSEEVYAKDIILKIIRDLGVGGGVGHVYEYGGEAIENLDMEGRLAVCNMSIEGGARAGYINPDQTTYEYLKGREYAPDVDDWDEHVEYWDTLRSGDDAEYDDVVEINADDLAPMVTWGINPGQVVSVDEEIPSLDAMADETARKAAQKAFDHMELNPGETMEGYDVDVAFLGTCTNGRFSDFKEAARVIEGKQIDSGVHGLAVPGSETVRRQCEAAGLDEIFREAGFEWRQAGCSMCLAMNNDSLEAGEVCASSSNRNFIGRQGDKEGRTVLMSPAMVAAAAIEGEITDIREHELTEIDTKTNPTAVVKGDD